MQHKKNKEAAVVVFSGGQDSTTCLLYAKKHYKKVYAVSFDYHQRHVAELDAAKEICEKLDVEQTIMDMTLLNQLAPNSLTRDDMKVDSDAHQIHLSMEEICCFFFFFRYSQSRRVSRIS